MIKIFLSFDFLFIFFSIFVSFFFFPLNYCFRVLFCKQFGLVCKNLRFISFSDVYIRDLSVSVWLSCLVGEKAWENEYENMDVVNIVALFKDHLASFCYDAFLFLSLGGDVDWTACFVNCLIIFFLWAFMNVPAVVAVFVVCLYRMLELHCLIRL